MQGNEDTVRGSSQQIKAGYLRQGWSTLDDQYPILLSISATSNRLSQSQA